MYLFHMVDTELFGLILETVEKSRSLFQHLKVSKR